MKTGFQKDWAIWFGEAQGGNKESYAKVLSAIVPVLTGFIRKKIGDSAPADDVLQSTLLKLHVSRHTYDPTQPLEPWLFTVARSAMNDFFRKEGRFRSVITLVEETWDQAAEGNLTEAAAAMGQAFEKLTDRQKEAIRLTAFEGHSMEEGAKIAGTSVSAFKVMVHRAQQSMKTDLGQEKKRVKGN